MKLKNEALVLGEHRLGFAHELEPEISEVALDILWPA